MFACFLTFRWALTPFCWILLGVFVVGFMQQGLAQPLPFEARNPDNNLQRLVRWDMLNLSVDQRQKLDSLDKDWKDTYVQVYPQIIRDREELRHLINQPNSDDNRIMLLQNRIHQNEERLRNEATQTFLSKRKLLRPDQMGRFRQMMIQD
ncbi:MAG: hypothetical protein SFZ03_01170 [Candidatus Melainabacteria bacterium]|nr:hypothetical protein [Candidatus Melainabacteria bacterium]